MPNLTGYINHIATDGLLPQNSGVFEITNTEQNTRATGYVGFAIFNMNFDASRVSSVYDSGATVRPAAVYTNWCVKF